MKFKIIIFFNWNNINSCNIFIYASRRSVSKSLKCKSLKGENLKCLKCMIFKFKKKSL